MRLSSPASVKSSSIILLSPPARSVRIGSQFGRKLVLGFAPRAEDQMYCKHGVVDSNCDQTKNVEERRCDAPSSTLPTPECVDGLPAA